MQQQDQSSTTEVAETIHSANEQVSARHFLAIEENSTFDQAENSDETLIEQADDDDSYQALAEQADDSDRAPAERDRQNNRLDWLAIGLVLLIAAFFALTARFNSQPAPSFIPAAALSATGCGLLVTALRKLRTITGAGLFEAALGGLGLALFQFAVALTYPGVLTVLTTDPINGHAFLLTWALICLFTILLSLAGAAFGHLAFAPLRSLQQQSRKHTTDEEDEDEETNEAEEQNTVVATVSATGNNSESQENPEEAELTVSAAEEVSEASEAEANHDEEENDEQLLVAGQARHSFLNYAITILILGLLPMMAGYVFAAIYDFTMNLINANQIASGLYPTLSLLSGLLPWRLAAPITLTGTNGQFIIFTLLWRIPDSFLGNPSTFDIQTLEPLLFNSAALALLLITMYRRKSSESKSQAAPWGTFLGLELLLGLFLILPPDLWLLQGLEGLLSLNGQDFALPTIHFLNPTLFILNLVTGLVFCLLVSLVVRRQYQLWNLPRTLKTRR